MDVGSLVASDEDEGSSMRWSDAETMKLLEWLLGTENTDWYEAFVKSPSHYFKKVCYLTYLHTHELLMFGIQASDELFGGHHPPSAIKGQWDHLLKIYKYILAFEGYTGNGGGDGDEDEEEDTDMDTTNI